MNRRVLIVDDEPAVCEMIERAVADAGMEPLALLNASRAAEVLNTEKFDMVFFDFHMAAPDGVELARQMRASLTNRSTPIVLVSDDQRPHNVSVGFQAGANFFLYKPIDKTRLVTLMHAVHGTIEQHRRRMRRVTVRQKVWVRSASENCEAETVDISLTGMLVESRRVFPLGSPVELSLELSKGEKPIRGNGLVARVAAGNQMAILVDRMTTAESQRLQEFLLPFVSQTA
ncbi:MAG TPA: response regulator [Candidatus Acidoferrales bacterium]|nr:response regulator [Candidatus Acidoferrales bacterium]